MNLVTVAEYVETDEIRLRMAALGVDYGQGFAIAKPAPLADLLVELPHVRRGRAERHRRGVEALAGAARS